MNGCKHETLQRGDDDYACAACGLPFLVEPAPARTDPEPAPKQQRDPASELVDVTGWVRFFVEAQSGTAPVSSRPKHR